MPDTKTVIVPAAVLLPSIPVVSLPLPAPASLSSTVTFRTYVASALLFAGE